MELGVAFGSDRPLSIRLAWLSGLRLVVLTGVLLVAMYLDGRLWFGGPSFRVALFTLVLAYGMTGLYAFMLKRGTRLTEVTYAQLLTDQVAWTGLIYVSGGAESGGTSLYGLTCLSGAMLMGAPGAVLAAAGALSSYTLMCLGLVSGRLPPPTDLPGAFYAVTWTEMATPYFVNVLGIVVATTLGSYFAERLRITGGRLMAATARAEEAEKLAILGRLAAGLAHEIRNPLSSIRGSVELLREGEELSPENRQLCELVERETARLDALVGDMLDLARPREPHPEVLDLAALVQEVLLLAGRSGRGTDVHMRYEGRPSVRIKADPGQMRQVVWNLVRNAVQASRPGDEVTASVETVAESVILEIRDRGPGIPQDQRARLFDAFYSTRAQGVGIGLAVVKRIVEAHGLEIEVADIASGGTVFRVRFSGRPRQQANAAA